MINGDDDGGGGSGGGLGGGLGGGGSGGSGDLVCIFSVLSGQAHVTFQKWAFSPIRGSGSM